jgi:cell shape-determining protein MreC
MKTSLLTKKANSRRILLIKRSLLAVGVIVVGVLLVMVVPIVIRVTVGVVWYPFDVVRVWMAESGSSLPQYIRERSTLIAELESYKIANSTERGDESTIKKLQIENDSFRTQLGAIPKERLLARVIARPNQLPYDMLMLDRGRDHGVIENAPVFLGKDQVIGFVSIVHDKTSLVTLLTTPGFVASAYVFGPNIYTETEGMGGGILRVRVPQGIVLSEHNLVMMPALDSGVYGEIAYVEAAPSQPEQYGYVRTAVPLQSLYYVTVAREGMVTHTFTEAKDLVANVKSSLFSVAVPPSELVVPETYSASSSVSSTTVPFIKSATTTATTNRSSH